MRELRIQKAEVIPFPSPQERKLNKMTAEQKMKLAVLQDILPNDPIWNVLFISNRDQGVLVDKMFHDIAIKLYD